MDNELTMPNTREKLIELLFKCGIIGGYSDIERIANWLIKDGVTVQEWIPVTERLPERDVLVICIGAKGGMFIGNPRRIYGDEDTAYTYVPNSRNGRNAKYWMPLPEPPKGE